MNSKTFLLLIMSACTAFVGCSSSAESAEEKTMPYDGIINKHPYVDLGLTVLWSPLNLGADAESDCGYYFAWGEVDTTKVEFTMENSTTYQKLYAREIIAKVDYDAARYYWRHTWRLPTQEELTELVEKCEWTKDTVDNRMGYTVKGPNGKTIFLPACGKKFSEFEAPDSCSQDGYYWSGSHTRGKVGKETAFALTFGVADSATVEEAPRYTGFCIRPVSDRLE
jgi:hypothetical protein